MPFPVDSGRARPGDRVWVDGEERVVVSICSAGTAIERARFHEMSEMQLVVSRDSSLSSVAGAGVSTYHGQRDRDLAVSRMTKPVRRLDPRIKE
jgi:hypothetical protein